MPFPIEYKLERSRDKGKSWSSLCHTHVFTSKLEIKSTFKKEHKNHPSDWLRIVKVEKSVVQFSCGDKQLRMKEYCGECALFYGNGHCHKNPKNLVIMRSGEPACADYHSREVCNNGDCERSRLGAEPCVGCSFCDEKGNI